MRMHFQKESYRPWPGRREYKRETSGNETIGEHFILRTLSSSDIISLLFGGKNRRGDRDSYYWAESQVGSRDLKVLGHKKMVRG
jgi:hypothetical protein